MPHSHLALVARCEVIEAEYRLLGGLGGMIASAAISSHKDLDIKSGLRNLHAMHLDAVAKIPYFTVSEDGKSALEREREEAVKQYKQMRGGVKDDSKTGGGVDDGNPT